MIMMRLQIAFDYLMVFTFVLLVFTLIFSSIAKQRVEFSSQQSFTQMQVIAQTIASEISYAGQAGNGYSGVFTLPSELSILKYNVSITKYGSVVVSSSVFGQLVQAVAFGGRYNIVSNSIYLVPPSNTYYNVPTYGGSGLITFQNSFGTICVDFSCPTTSNTVVQLALTESVAGAFEAFGNGAYAAAPNTAPFQLTTGTYTGWVSYRGPAPNYWNWMAAKQGNFGVGACGSAKYSLFPCFYDWGSSTNYVSPFNILPNSWVMLTAVMAGGVETVYVNGVQVLSDPSTGSSQGVDLQIGAGGGSSAFGQFLNGSVSNVQIYSTPLGQSQIQSLYSEGIAGQPIPGAGLVSWWPLGGNGNDYSGNGYALRFYNPAYFQSVDQITATVTNNTANSIQGALVGFSTNLGKFINGPSTYNLTNSNSIAVAFLSQGNQTGDATVTATAFNGNQSTSQSLVSWFPLNLRQGSNVYDISPQSNGQTYLYGNAVGASWAYPAYVASFGSPEGYIQIPSRPALKLDQLTINAWVDPSGPSSGGMGWIASSQGAYGLALCGSSLLACYYDWSGGTGMHSSGASLTPGYWYMLTAVINSGPTGGTETLYVNGAMVESDTLTVSAVQNAMEIGGISIFQGGLTQSFNGSISNVQIYSSALGLPQIGQLYGSGIGGNPISSSIVAWYPLDGNAGDYSGNGNNGTIYGNVQMISPQGLAQFSTSHVIYASFNGVDSSVEASNSTMLNIQSKSITLNAWVNFTSYQGSNINWAFGAFDTHLLGVYGAGVCSPALVVCYFNQAGPGTYYSSTDLLYNKWYMLTAVVNGTTDTETMYVNSANIVTGPLSQSIPAISFYLGSSPKVNQGHLSGGMSDVQMYSGALTPAQIEQLYSEGVSGNPITAAKIISWFPLGGTTNDYSNPNDFGIASNILYYANNFNPVSETPSMSESGMYFSGQGSNVLISNPEQISGSALTVSAWAYPVSVHNSAGYLGVVGNTAAYRLSMDQVGQGMEANFSAKVGGVWVSALGKPSISINSWSLLTGVYNGSDVNLYINGALAANVPASGTISGASGLTSIGFWQGASPNYFNGTIADVQVYNSALNAEQASQLYAAGAPITQTISAPLGGFQ